MQETSETKMILREYFTGEGASVRRRKFLWDVFLYSSKYFLICICLFSWALVSGLLIGPKNEFFKELPCVDDNYSYRRSADSKSYFAF